MDHFSSGSTGWYHRLCPSCCTSALPTWCKASQTDVSSLDEGLTLETTVEPPVSEHPKYEDLDFALIREWTHRGFLRSTFWKTMYCVQL